ncbi:uncharacterized protein TNCV_3778031 [Trichonephila clavipes]|nr:uncharacterized protein TNCV_3778031 [Trichonephila clavipes]
MPASGEETARQNYNAVISIHLYDSALKSDTNSRDRPAKKRILFSDEAHFWLNGYVNKQNCLIWSEANPQVYVENTVTSRKTDCLVRFMGWWNPSSKNDEGHNVTVNGDRYRAMITNFFIPELNNHDVQELWFQQDGATCHTARATIDLLKDTFWTCELASKIL